MTNMKEIIVTSPSGRKRELTTAASRQTLKPAVCGGQDGFIQISGSPAVGEKAKSKTLLDLHTGK